MTNTTIAARRLDKEWERLVTVYGFSTEHWTLLRTTDVVECPFATMRLRTAGAKGFKAVDNATAVIGQTRLLAERTFHRLDAPEVLAEVAEGAVYVDGVPEKRGNKRGNKRAAA